MVGAHMRGLSLNGALTQRHAVFCECTRTAPCYRLYALPGAPVRPCLVREALKPSLPLVACRYFYALTPMRYDFLETKPVFI